ncbi:MAG: hypothetical protein HUJ65_01040, partial [Oscillospiraceae bacterium]|nr:hypothetical protein [Oscillospiraceae bacterium]
MKIRQINEKFSFSTQAVDAISEICVDAMRQTETDRKDVIRVRLSIEEILERWLGTMEGSDIAVKTYTRFGRNHVEISVAGPRADDSDDSGIAMFGNRLLAQSGVAPVTSYKNGCNILSLTLYKKRKMSPMALLILSIVLGALFGLLINALPESAGSFILSITGPIFSKLLDLLRLVAMPMILLGVCGGIVGMGDIQTISKIGRTIIFRFVLYTFVIGAALTVILSFFVPVSFV